MRLLVAAATLAVIATPAMAEPKIDVQGLILGNEGARYLQGVPTLDLQQQRGAVQLRFLEWDHGGAVFAVGVYNGGPDPANVGLENLHASAGGSPVRVYTLDELKSRAKNRAMWGKIGLAVLGGLGAAAAASQRDTYSGHITGPYGSYHYSGSYPSLAGQLQADRILDNTSAGMALIQYRLDQAIETARNYLLQTTTVDPGMTFAGLVFVQKLDYGKAPLEFRLDVDWNGERYPFGYLLQKKGQPVPASYAARLASNAKPMALSNRTTNAVAQPTLGPVPKPTPRMQHPEGAIVLASGAMKIPAKTASGYCLKAPPGYVGAGSINFPSITGALPRCTE
jgi:hypothetical protein